MKTLKYLVFTLFLSSSTLLSSQSLPINFETDIVTEDFQDFDGGTGTVVANPLINSANNSGFVGKIVRNGGEIWSGSKIALGSNLDFSDEALLSMQVYTTAPVGTLIKFKLEGAGSTEIDVPTTVSGEWETLYWDFTGTPMNFNELVFMFDYGITGDGSTTSTFYFDNIKQQGGALEQIDLPVTFEDEEINYTMTNFGGNTSELMVDPTDGSNHVMRVVKNVAAVDFAGTTISTPSGFVSNIPFTSENTTMSVRVWSATPNTPVRLKVENANNPGQTCETQVNTTTTGIWETLVFDFSNEVPSTAELSYGLSNGWTYNKASIFFNFGTDGATAGEQSYFFDDVAFGGESTGGGLDQIDLPVTFEDMNVDYTMTDFEGGSSTQVADPTDSSNQVMEVNKDVNASPYAGTTISTPSGLASNIPFSSTETIMTVRVWSPTSNTPIRLKVENANDPTQTCETETSTTVSGEWEVLEFDFSQQVTGTAELSTGLTNGWIYSKVSIFFNFGTDGATAGDQTYYFDDVYFGEQIVDNVEMIESKTFSIFPNPSSSEWTISNELNSIQSIQLYDTQGKLISNFAPNSHRFSLDNSAFESGMYIAIIHSNKASETHTLIKE